jgi:hypothetical protein
MPSADKDALESQDSIFVLLKRKQLNASARQIIAG